MAQDGSVGQGQPEQPMAEDFQPAVAVAVMDPSAEEPVPESAATAEKPEDSANESVMETKEPDTEAAQSASVSDPIGAAEPSSAQQESTSEAAIESGVEEIAPIAVEPQNSIFPTDISAQEATETALVSEPESTASADPGMIAEGESAEAAVGVSSEPSDSEVPVAVESELSAPQDVVDSAVTEVEQLDNSQDSNLDTPSMAIEEIAETKTKERSAVIEPLAVSPIPARAAFLPVQSARNRPGYTLRGLF
jgi:hypothetical protein